MTYCEMFVEPNCCRKFKGKGWDFLPRSGLLEQKNPADAKSRVADLSVVSEKMKLDLDQLCDILQGLLDGSRSPEEARAQLDRVSFEELDELYGNLFHYLSDADIRERDEGYRELQDSEMRKLIQHLEAGNLAKANEITFLNKTEDSQQ